MVRPVIDSSSTTTSTTTTTSTSTEGPLDDGNANRNIKPLENSCFTKDFETGTCKRKYFFSF